MFLELANYLQNMPSKYLIPLLISNAIALSISPAWGQSNTASEITFACQNHRGVPITFAKNSKGKTQTIFHWKQEALTTAVKTPQELCDRTSEKFNDYAAEGNNLSSLRIRSAEQLGLPAICITEEKLVCSKVLFTLAPHEQPIDFAQTTLTKILDRNLQSQYNTNNLAFQGRCADRGCQSFFPSFQLNLFPDK
jgi:hypothetical protein